MCCVVQSPPPLSQRLKNSLEAVTDATSKEQIQELLDQIIADSTAEELSEMPTQVTIMDLQRRALGYSEVFNIQASLTIAKALQDKIKAAVPDLSPELRVANEKWNGFTNNAAIRSFMKDCDDTLLPPDATAEQGLEVRFNAQQACAHVQRVSQQQ